jgi:2-hydroxy-3-keto-5-methylthiopentenyl-1-phosphate phosphatase
MSVKDKSPRPLKRVDNSDLLTIKDNKDDYYVVTKQETIRVIKEFIQSEIGNIPEEFTERHKNELSQQIRDKMLSIEKNINKRLDSIENNFSEFINSKFDSMAEKASELLIKRRFLEELNKKVEEKLENKKRKVKS